MNHDIILMVETYGSGKMIADSLAYNFHLIASKNTPDDAKNINLSIRSKFPLGERFDFYNQFNIGGIEIMLDLTLEAIASKIIKEPFNNDVIINGKSFMYPSDHGLVFTTFSIK